MPTGTVYCNCAHTVEPEMQMGGGRLPEPVSSYTTSTPADVKTRRVVEPVHVAPAYSALHMLTVNVWPALAVTPQVGSLFVSVLVWLALYSWQDKADVGANVVTEVGSGVGCVGPGVGEAEGQPGGVVGLAEGSAVGRAVGIAVVGSKVGKGDGRRVGRDDGAGVGAYVTSLTPAGPAMMAVPEHVVAPTQPSRMMYVCKGVPAGTVYCTWAHEFRPMH